jgi:DtxR family Mn-dependent transcriptional regulator
MPALSTDDLTTSVEDYLKAIYAITRQGHPATTSEIARWLDLSPPSVSGMVKRLSQQGLLEYQPYKGVKLTAKGRRAALTVLRRHRIIESYLVERLGYSWDSVHQEAERLEHAVSDVLIERMAQALGNPEVDPHGDPIPRPDGTIAEAMSTPLPDIDLGREAALRQVRSSDSEQLRFIASVGLKLGSVFTVVDQQPFDGPTTICLGDTEQVIGHQLASLLWCEVRGVDG